MTTKEALGWFKNSFWAYLQNAVKGTPYDEDLLTAIAYQETGSIWSNMAGKLPITDIARFCTGDSLDYPNRIAFPKNKAALLAEKDGQKMFDIAHQALVDMSKYVPGYSGVARNANKFCHGYGIFQYDLQHFKTDPQYFLQKKWSDIDLCFSKCISELKNAQRRMGWSDKTALTTDEKVYVAIAYNKGVAKLSLGFKQGHQSGGKYYGENIFAYYSLSKTISMAGEGVVTAPIAEPTVVLSLKQNYVVKVDSMLNLRSETRIPTGTQKNNVLVRLPNGHNVRGLIGKPSDTWMLVETVMNGAYFRGYVAGRFLIASTSVMAPVRMKQGAPIESLIAEAHLHTANAITRQQVPNLFSLSEKKSPQRNLTGDPMQMSDDLLAILTWLGAKKKTHKRYQFYKGQDGSAILAHDYCRQAGVYLPRVWWTGRALVQLANNQTLTATVGETVRGMNANQLFYWLNDFGQSFGWRQTGTLNNLQNAANLGAVALVVARHIGGAGPGRIGIISPEKALTAKRDKEGKVLLPIQTFAAQANQELVHDTDWWNDAKRFAEYGFWIHG